MSDKKLYKKLPGLLQTTALKNFFESTVEQLFSEAEVENIQGYIGRPSSDDIGAAGKYVKEPTVTKRFYSLTPAVNTINPATAASDNFVFYDELIDILSTYGVDARNHNKLFGEQFATFLPPIDVDKLINYQEYYWFPRGPTTISVQGTLQRPIDIDRDVIGQPFFTPPSGKPFRNGMIVRFVGDYVIPTSKLQTEFIVEGVGESIFFVPKNDNFSTRFTTIADDEYDLDSFGPTTGDNVRHSAAALSEVLILHGGVGYAQPQALIYDDSRISDPALLAQFPQLREVDPVTELPLDVIGLETLVNHLTVNGTIEELTQILEFYDTYRIGALAQTQVTTNVFGAITEVEVLDGGENYYGDVKIAIYDKGITNNVNVLAMTVTSEPLITNTFEMESVDDVMVGQIVSGVINGRVIQVIQEDVPQGITAKIVLETQVSIDTAELSGNPQLTFKGNAFDAELRFDDMHIVSFDAVEILNTQARLGVNPNNPADYYLIGGVRGFDRDIDGDGIGDVPWAGTATQLRQDYLIQQRGARNRNVWSRINFWYHRDNFKDAGDSLPNRRFRANRPIIEFDRHLELFNHGETSIGSVVTAANELRLSDIDGANPGALIDNVPVENATFIFPTESPSVAKYVYTAKLVVDPVQVIIVGDGTDAEATATISGKGQDSRISSIQVTNTGSGYTEGNVSVQIIHPYGVGAEAIAVVSGGQIADIQVVSSGSGYYEPGKIRVARAGDPIRNPPLVEDGQPMFVPLEVLPGQTVQIIGGTFGIGKEYIWDGTEWAVAQEKININQAPLFNLYDTNGVYLGDHSVYPNNNFDGNKIFGYATQPGDNEQPLAVLGSRPDRELGFPLVFKQFKASSEIVFENFIFTTKYSYTK